MQHKIHFNFRLQIVLVLIFPIMLCTACHSQKLSYKKPTVTSSCEDYRLQIAKDSVQTMIELKSVSPTLIYNLRYATTNNFMKRAMYPKNTNITFLRYSAAIAIKKIQNELIKNGLGLKIFDAYRPYHVTQKFWELVHDDRYVANPATGSGHNRGTTIDLTIINLSSTAELDMGTGFDNFTDSAHHEFKQLPSQVLENRLFLKNIMEKYGFKAYNAEWWHYSWVDETTYPILDISFKKLSQCIN